MQVAYAFVILPRFISTLGSGNYANLPGNFLLYLCRLHGRLGVVYILKAMELRIHSICHLLTRDHYGIARSCSLSIGLN